MKALCMLSLRKNGSFSLTCGSIQVPEKVFVTDKLPKTATGKIQRRMMVEAFIKKGDSQTGVASQGKPDQPSSKL